MKKIVILVALTAVAALALMSTAAAGTSDRNRDRIPDKWEKRHDLSLKVVQTRRDQDRDGLDNLGEFRAGTDPRDRDSDDDGIRDGKERPGTVKSFDGTTLVISLFGGGTVEGRVTAATEVTCGAEDSATTASRVAAPAAGTTGTTTKATTARRTGQRPRRPRRQSRRRPRQRPRRPRRALLSRRSPEGRRGREGGRAPGDP